MKTITEGNAKFKTHLKKIVSKDMPVFYNPVMKFNRDMSVLLLNSIENINMQLADPLAGTGIRAVRLLTELKKDKIKLIHINDISEDAVKLIKTNIELNENNLNTDEIEVSNLDANEFLINFYGYDYIDIDPFGSPNKFLESAINRISRKGILAVTATDTAPLCGTYPKTCKRKYFAKPLRNEHMHELGLRILIRKVQLIAAQFDKALTPIFSYYKDHYFRIFFKATKSKTKVDDTIKQHGFFHYCNVCTDFFTSKNNNETHCKKTTDVAGPLWIGKLNDEKLLKTMIKNNDDKTNEKILKTIYDETKINQVGFYDIHKIAKKYKFSLPKFDKILSKDTVRTHFTDTGVKSKLEFKKILGKINP